MPQQHRRKDDDAPNFTAGITEAVSAALSLSQTVIGDIHELGLTLARIEPVVDVLSKIVRDGNGEPPLMLTVSRLSDRISELTAKIDTHAARMASLETGSRDTAGRWTFKTQVVLALIALTGSVVTSVVTALVTLNVGGNP